MKSLRVLAIGAALIAGSSALASAQPYQHRDGGPQVRGGDRGQQVDRGRNDRQFVRNDRQFVRNDQQFVRNDRRSFVREEPRFVVQQQFFVGEQRFFNGFYWTWDGYQWLRHNRGLTFYLNF